MNPSIAYRIVISTPDLLVLQELPYTVVGCLGIVGSLFMALVAIFAHWRFGSPRRTFLALLIGAGICMLVSVWLTGLQFEFSFLRRQAIVEVRMAWFDITISNERMLYTVPPIAEVLTTEGTTQGLVLRFSDGRIKKLGLSTDRVGHDEAVQLINHFLQTGSVLK